MNLCDIFSKVSHVPCIIEVSHDDIRNGLRKIWEIGLGFRKIRTALRERSKVLNVLTPQTAQLCVVEFYSLVRGVLFQHGESYPNNSTHDYLMST